MPIRVVIVSADKDLMPLVGPDVLLWDTMRDKVWGAAEVTERFGVRVNQVRDLLALTGDSSDNIPGVPSIGAKNGSATPDRLPGYRRHLYEHRGDQAPKTA